MRRIASDQNDGDVLRLLDQVAAEYEDKVLYRRPEEVLGDVRERCREALANTVAAHRTATGAMLETDVRSRLPEIAAPTLVVLGELESADLHRMGRMLADGMPDVRLGVVSGVGHMLSMEKPVEFNRMLRDFLR